MKELIKAVRGTQDILPKDSYKRNYIENFLKKEAEICGFKEIRTPVFEHTELFLRSVGETTDVVQKEMYTFPDKGGRSITLRPEGTAGVVRSVLENGLYNNTLPIKVSYITSCYRYEKPQAGRLREFNQFGLEVFGSASPTADAELINVANSIFLKLNVKNLSLQINSIGCHKCRAEFIKALKDYFSSYKENLCQTCIDRLERNPMRILDCKSPICKEIAKNSPVITDYLCKDCSSHFEQVKAYLKSVNVNYQVNPKIVRGLDYYTKTVFEFVSNDIGAQGTVCGGGRYDGLVEELGGKPLPALGFGLGIERLSLLLENQNIKLQDEPTCGIYIASVGESAKLKAFDMVNNFRKIGISADLDIMNKSLKAQMKYADKIRAKFVIVLGEEELNKKVVTLKNMASKEMIEEPLNEELYTKVAKKFK